MANTDLEAVFTQLQNMQNDSNQRFDDLKSRIEEQHEEIVAVKKDLEKSKKDDKKNDEFEDGGGELAFGDEDKDLDAVKDVNLAYPKDGMCIIFFFSLFSLFFLVCEFSFGLVFVLFFLSYFFPVFFFLYVLIHVISIMCEISAHQTF